MTGCPPLDELREFLSDRLDGQSSQTIEAHVETCAGCQQALEELTDGAELRRGRRSLSQDEIALLRRLDSQPPTTVWAAAAQRVTGTQVPSRFPGGGRRGAQAAGQINVAGLAGRGSQSTTEIQTLLRKRLKFVALMSCAGFAVYLLNVLLLYSEALLIAMYTVMLVITGGLARLVWSRRPLSMQQLRRIEVALFASLGLFFTSVQCRFFSAGLLPAVAQYGFLGSFLLARSLSFNWFVMIILYGILIPNTWRRCAVVVGLMAIWPLLLNASAGLWGPLLDARQMANFLLESSINMTLAASLAVYGSHRIEVLRQQVSETRKLGQYRLTKRLGEGAMGEVYLAEHLLLRRPCAIKVIRPERVGDPSNLVRFEREVQATATLTHPNTVEILDYGNAEDGTFYYVMEYLPGLTLEQLVGHHGPLPPERTIHLLKQTCGALEEAHAIGLIHRDIKPGNILVCERGGQHDVAKLLDFGLVREQVLQGEQRLTEVGVIAGTPGYMSPEQAAGKTDLDRRSDIYSLGAVAYFLLAGQPPFVRQTAMQTLAAQLYEVPTRLDSHRADIPADLRAVVERCLEKAPDRRFATADALQEALSKCGCANDWTRAQASAWWSERRPE
jgi:serine/threonine-protein kinase